MKIAIPYENGTIFQHFGRTEQFKIYTVEDGKVVSSEVISTNGSGHGALSGLLGRLGVSKVICGGIGGGAKNALAAAGIKLYGGVQGNADEQLQALLRDELAYDPDTECDHHSHHGGFCGQHEDCRH